MPKLPTDKKIVTRAALRREMRKMRRQGKRIVFTNGCFDILHAGHLKVLHRAKRAGDVLVVGLNSTSSVRALKGHGRPVMPEAERASLLAALEYVDYVVLFRTRTPRNLIISLMPDVLVKGGDWKPGSIVGAREIRARGGKVLAVPYESGKSTTSIITRIRNGH